MSRDIFAALKWISHPTFPASGPYVAPSPRPDADDALKLRTRRFLSPLSHMTLPFDLPRCRGCMTLTRGGALSWTFAQAGNRVCARGRCWARSWRRFMASTPLSLQDFLPSSAPPREHALEVLRVFDGLDVPRVREARIWAGGQPASRRAPSHRCTVTCSARASCSPPRATNGDDSGVRRDRGTRPMTWRSSLAASGGRSRWNTASRSFSRRIIDTAVRESPLNTSCSTKCAWWQAGIARRSPAGVSIRRTNIWHGPSNLPGRARA